MFHIFVVALPVLTPSLLVSECSYKDGEATSLLQINYIRFMQRDVMKENRGRTWKRPV